MAPTMEHAPLDIDQARRIQQRVRALAGRHAELLQQFWNTGRKTFGLLGAHEAEDRVTSACTCALSIIDADYGPAPTFFDAAARAAFVDWLMTTQWDSAGLGENNVYTAPLALTTLRLLEPKQLANSKAQSAISRMMAEFERDPYGPICYKQYPPSGYLTYWAVRALWDAAFPEGQAVLPPDRELKLQTYLMDAVAWAESELHKQFSFYTVNDLDHFDALDMAYLLGLSDFARRHRRLRPHGRLIAMGLRILFQTQLANGLWPKGSPIFHYPAGGDVYPFAFETLVAVMQVGRRSPFEPGLFSDNSPFAVDFLEAYIDGLLATLGWAEANELRHNGMTGWRSNNVLPKPSEGLHPHSWATAMVLSFARGLDALVRQLIRRHRLREFATEYAPVSNEQPVRSETWANELADSDPRPSSSMHPRSLKQLLFKKIVLPHIERTDARKWSLILYGPPGTAKTRLASEIAAALGWPLVRIGTADFLTDGRDRMAQRALLLFRKLEQLYDAVVFIDEVEEFVRDRKNHRTDPQGRLTTTAMLTLIQNLNDKRSVLLILATNHIEDFDIAIRRPGRFDAVVLVMPPTFEAKVARLGAASSSKIGVNGPCLLDLLTFEKEMIERLTFPEWNALEKRLKAMYDASDVAQIRAALQEAGEGTTIDPLDWPTWLSKRSRIYD